MAAAKLIEKQLDCKDLHGYLRTLPASVLDKLYNHPATCIAVFRELPELGKHCVMRVLFIDKPVGKLAVESWVKKTHQEGHREAIELLSALRLWHDSSLPGGAPGWLLNPIFRTNLKTALLGGGQSWSSSADGLGPDKHAKDVESLDKYAMERWECVLHFLVQSRGVDTLSRDVALVLAHAGLMKEAEEGTMVITPAGFQFLLLDTASQVWHFMLQYLETAEARELRVDLVEALSFLFQLSFSTLGKAYSTDGISESKLQFLQHLRELGLVFQRKRKDKRFYPTRLAINLASGISNVSSDTHRDGYLVAETNYRVYAYTESELQIEILGLFCQMLYRFPNMAVATLTRESVTSAVSNGITAQQILHYLRTHAHPEMRNKVPIIPPVISDQVRLWELERDRLRFTPGVIYNEFMSNQEYVLLRDYAKDLNVLVHENAAKRTMIVTPSGHDDVKRFWRRYRQGQEKQGGNR